MKIRSSLTVLLFVLLAPAFALAQTTSTTNASIASLTAQVQALIAQINALQGQTGSNTGTVAGSGACPQINRVLSLGSSGNDVSSLQQFLAANPSIYPEGMVTGYYGGLTQTAVQRWQSAHNIVSSGSPGTTGYGVVGPRTAAAMQSACTGGSSGAGSPIVSGFLQLSPIAGNAPLTVTITATVNTANACGGGTYTLSFGDGTPSQSIPLPAGNCSQASQVFQHTYQYGGTYTVALSAGSHQSTATVTVSGTGAPGNGGVGTNTSQPTGSISALVASGPAPLSTTFYVSCASGLAYDIVFGDGTDLGSSGVSQSSCNGSLQAVSHTYSAPGSYTAQLEIFVRNPNGAVTPVQVATQSITAGSTSSSSASGGGSYQPPTLVPNAGGNPLAISLQYSYDSSNCQLSITWGDGTSLSPTTCSTFSGTLQSYTQTHTYAAAGSYTITLKRASQTDSVGVSISS